MTEKDYNPNMKENKAMNKQKAVSKQIITKAPETKKNNEENSSKLRQITENVEDKTKKTEIEKTKSKNISKKTQAEVNCMSVPISTKQAMAICKFIKYKRIDKAIADLKEVIKHKKIVPMRGEIPHRHGEGVMSGRYPLFASQNFITILKGLKGNANVNGIEEPVIAEAVANFAPRPFGRFGSVQRRRTHIRIIARNKKQGGEK